MNSIAVLTTLTALALLAGCRRDPPVNQDPANDHTEHAGHDEHDEHSKPDDHDHDANHVAVPANVRRNLGITFAKVERRAVTRTLRLPGAFELLPTATREYHAAATGRVELLVGQYERVEAGRVLYRLDSPRLREMQQQLADAAAAVTLAKAAVDSLPAFFAAHEKHHDELGRSVAMWEARVKQLADLQSAGGGQATELAAANASLSQARVDFAETLEKEAELNARKTDADAAFAAAKQKAELLLAGLSSLVGRPADELTRSTANGPAWKSITAIDVEATTAGVVGVIGATNGGHVESATLVLTVIAPEQVRFRARGYQSDLGRLRAGLPARVVPPAGMTDPTPTTAPMATPATEAMAGPLMLAPRATADARTIDLLVTPKSVAAWAIDGVSGFVEITLDGTDAPQPAIPATCVVRDGLTPIVFRRNAKEPDEVFRIEADLGVSDGRWVVVGGLNEGDEVVQDGVYQLLVATSKTTQQGGHFHADGSFHEGKEGKD